ncbi:subtilisin-like protein [Xylariomycetidae sp. FL0641]|nr:subtilisin-like protein [Xylariomycetidae sp. FL0641]
MRLTSLIYLLAWAELQVTATPLYSHDGPTVATHPVRRSVPQTHIRHEKRTVAQAQSWSRLGRANATSIFPMRIGLQQPNLRKGHELLMDISDPESANYGKHLSAEEVVDFFAPPQSSIDAVKSWLVESGIHADAISQSANKQWIQFDAPVDEVENLLFTDYHVYEHIDTGVKNFACDQYHVPKHVRSHIDYITPGIKLMGHGNTQEPPTIARRDNPRTKPRVVEAISDIHSARAVKTASKRTTGPSVEGPLRFAEPIDPQDIGSGNTTLDGGCDTYITPDCIRALYGIPKGTKHHPDNKMGIFQSLGQHYTQEDLDTFFYGFTDDIPNGTHPELLSVNGGQGPTTSLRMAGSESNLDFQMAYGLIWPQEPVLYQVDDEWYQEAQQRAPLEYTGFFNNLWNAIDGSYCTFEAFGEKGNCARPECRDPEYPNPHDRSGYSGELMCGVYKPTNVISISYSGAEAELPASYQQRQCAEIMKLGLQGTTVVIASGDDGVGGFASSASPSGCLGPNHDVFNPQFLASCPYILAVGSTVLPTNRTTDGPEEATQRFRSGGGFSNIYETPAWQRGAVDAYLAAAAPTLGFAGYEGGGGGANYSNATTTAGGRFNRRGRAYPDVAASGDRFVIASGGELLRIGGTSASAPLWGAVLTLLNEERLAAGKRGPVGFVHPALYAHPEAFRDVTVGDNRACKSLGFPAREGWDPVTGLGTPDYPKLLELFMSLP